MASSRRNSLRLVSAPQRERRCAGALEVPAGLRPKMPRVDRNTSGLRRGLSSQRESIVSTTMMRFGYCCDCGKIYREPNCRRRPARARIGGPTVSTGVRPTS